MKELHYNFVYWNSHYLPDYQAGKLDPDEYNAICLNDAKSMEGVHVCQCQLEQATPWLRRLQIRHERWHRLRNGIRSGLIHLIKQGTKKPYR